MFCLIIWFVIYLVHAQVAFVQPHIKADAYIAPRDCPLVRYEAGADAISCACAAKNYKFTEANKYGFTYLARRNNAYYRIGNDAVEIAEYAQGICTRHMVVHGVFHQ